MKKVEWNENVRGKRDLWAGLYIKEGFSPDPADAINI